MPALISRLGSLPSTMVAQEPVLKPCYNRYTPRVKRSVQCAAQPTSPEQTRTSSSAAAPPSSWPSIAARSAAFAPTFPEHQEGCTARVTGKLPEWLRGSYIRNGPGTYDNGTVDGFEHMFDGYACLIKMQVDGETNSVVASHRFLESQAYKSFKETGKMKWREFATAVPHNNVLGKVGDVATMALGSMGLMQGVTDNASVNVLSQGDQIWAVTETVAGTLVVDADTLKTLGPVRYSDSLFGDLTTAHPALLSNGDAINLLSAPGVGFTVYRQPHRTNPATELPKRERLATIRHRRPLSPAWVHDFPCSETHAIIPETPIYFNLGALMLGTQTEHIFLDWIPEDGATMHVTRISDGTVKSFKVPPFFVFHWANAFEFESKDGRYLHIDGAVYSDPEIVNHLYLKNVKAGQTQGASQLPRAQLLRLTLDLEAPDGSQVEEFWRPLVPDSASYGDFCEFPCVNPKKKGKLYRYTWTTCAVRPTNVNNALAKMDVEQGTCQVWHEPGGIVGEPKFVPRPGATEEDDGVMVAVVTQPDGMAAMLVLDGKSHKEVARAILPYSLTNGFHGVFVPAK